jgi:hypothetical protein
MTSKEGEGEKGILFPQLFGAVHQPGKIELEFQRVVPKCLSTDYGGIGEPVFCRRSLSVARPSLRHVGSPLKQRAPKHRDVFAAREGEMLLQEG